MCQKNKVGTQTRRSIAGTLHSQLFQQWPQEYGKLFSQGSSGAICDEWTWYIVAETQLSQNKGPQLKISFLRWDQLLQRKGKNKVERIFPLLQNSADSSKKDLIRVLISLHNQPNQWRVLLQPKASRGLDGPPSPHPLCGGDKRPWNPPLQRTRTAKYHWNLLSLRRADVSASRDKTKVEDRDNQILVSELATALTGRGFLFNCSRNQQKTNQKT